MRKISKVILTLLIICLPIKVWALDNKVILECPATVNAGATINCVIKGTSSQTIATFEALVSVDEDMEITSSQIDSNIWQGTLRNNKFGLYGGNVTGNFEIAQIKLKISDTASGELTLGLAGIKMGIFSNEGSYPEASLDNTNVSTTMTVNQPQEQRGLRSLSIEGCELVPIFNSSTYGYTVVINSDTFKVTAEPNNPNDSITIYNEADPETPLTANNITYVPHNNDNMLIVIEVGAGDNKVGYQVIVERHSATTEYNNTLGSLTIGTKSVNLSTGIYDSEYDAIIYKVKLKNIQEYQVEATPADPDNFEIDPENGGLGTWHNAANIIIIVRPINNTAFQSKKYIVEVSEEEHPPVPSSSKEDPIGGNPGTGNISIFIITSILIASLIISLYVYRKNIENFD